MKKIIILFICITSSFFSGVFFCKLQNKQLNVIKKEIKKEKNYTFYGESKNWEAEMEVLDKKLKNGEFYNKKIFKLKYKGDIKTSSINTVEWEYSLGELEYEGKGMYLIDSFNNENYTIGESSGVSNEEFKNEIIKVKVFVDENKDKLESFELKLDH